MNPKMPSGCCPCSCPHCGKLSSSPWRRSLKRKLDQADGVVSSPATVPARVEVENEVTVLREAVASQQSSIQDLCEELEEERSAAASAASETMSMILRLQREKAEVQMEARQFKRFAEEKMAHDQDEIAALEDLLFGKDQALHSLSYEVQAYKHRLLSLGVSPEDPFADPDVPDSPAGCSGYDYGYPPLRCTVPADVDPEEECVDLEKYTFGGTPFALERRIYELEKMRGSSGVMEKEVVDRPLNQHCSRASDGSSALETNSVFVHENEVRGGKEGEEPTVPVDDIPEGDDASDRVYTIDAVHVPVGCCAEWEDYGAPLKDAGKGGTGEEEADIKKLHTRLQALEADRESMRQALISMRTEKAQLVLLREIAQQLCKEAVPERSVKKQQPLMKNFSFASIIKCVRSIVFWRRKAARTKYPFGPSSNNVGLLLLLDKSPRLKQWTAGRMQR